MDQPPDEMTAPLPARVWKIAGIAAAGSFVAHLDATIVNVSLPGLAREMGVGLTVIQWVMSGYLLTLALCVPLAGWLVDRIGARAVYLRSILAFTLLSALCSLAWSAGTLIGLRLLQGMSAGVLAPMAQMLVARAAGARMARVAGIITMPILLAPLLGPGLAGAILEFGSWRWLFLVNLPVGLAILALAARVLPDERGTPPARQLDLAGLALLSPGLGGVVYGGAHLATTAGTAIAGLGAACLALYVRHARRWGEAALVDLRLLRGGVFRAGVATMFLSTGANFAGQMLVAAWLVGACGVAPARAGALMAAMGLGMMCGYPLTGRLSERFGVRRVSGGGALVGLLATLPLVAQAFWGLVPGVLEASLFVRGLAQGVGGIPANAAGYASVRREALPNAATVMNIGQRLGGPCAMTACAALPGHSAHPFTAGFVVLAALHVGLLMVTTRLPLRMPQPSG